MAFMNEFVSEEDINRNGLDQLQKEFNQRDWADGRPSVFRHAWTIDKEEGSFLVPVHTFHEVGRSGRPEPTRKRIWVLDLQGRRARATLDKAPGSSSGVQPGLPYRIIWQLMSLDLTEVSGVPRETVIETLKRALVAYGAQGVYYQAPNTVVEFQF